MATVDVTCGLIFSNDRVFICRRKPDKSLGGYWEFPGGKVESGETCEECLARELREELGMEVLVGQKFMTNEHSYEHIAIRLIAYRCEFISFNQTLTDHDKYEWACVDELTSWNFAPADIPIAAALAELTVKSSAPAP